MSALKFLTAADILNAKDLREKVIEVPEWGGSVTLRELTANDRDWLQASMVTDADDVKGAITIENEGGTKLAITGFQTKLVALSIVDESGKRLFNNDQIKDLADKSGIVLTRIASECVTFNKMENDEEDLKAAGEDLPATELAGSDSALPDSSDVPPKSSEIESAEEN